MPDVMADRRGARRFSLILVAEILLIPGDSRINARSSDISGTGCYIDTLSPLPRGSRVRARFTQNSENFDSVGVVAYVSAGLGMGIGFDEPIPPAQLSILDRCLLDATRSSS